MEHRYGTVCYVYKVVVNFGPVNETLKCDHSLKSTNKNPFLPIVRWAVTGTCTF